MGCFLGCFGKERKEERKERRRRRSAKRLRPSLQLNQRNGSPRPFQQVAIQSRQPSLAQITPGLSPLKLPLDPAVESAYCAKTFPLDQSVESFSSEKTLPLESPVELVSSEKALPEEDPPVHSINEEKLLLDPPVLSVTLEKPPLQTPVEPSKSRLSEIRGANEENCSTLPRKKVTFDLNVKTYEPVLESYSSSDDEIEEDMGLKSKLLLSPTYVTFPSNHRYQNCDSDDEIDEMEEEEEEEEGEVYYYSDDEEEEGLDELDEGIGINEIGIAIEGNDEESYESFFSLSMDKEKELSDKNTNEEVSSLISKNAPASSDILGLLIRDRSQFVYPVLNPVENLSKWKQAKVNTTEKETNKDKKNDSNLYKENKEEVAVNASLSTWLVSRDNSTVENGQVGNVSLNSEDRPILGALTVEDIKESSVNSSPRRSPSQSPNLDDVPIIGTVGSYWSCNSNRIGSRSTRFREEKLGKCN